MIKWLRKHDIKAELLYLNPHILTQSQSILKLVSIKSNPGLGLMQCTFIAVSPSNHWIHIPSEPTSKTLHKNNVGHFPNSLVSSQLLSLTVSKLNMYPNSWIQKDHALSYLKTIMIGYLSDLLAKKTKHLRLQHHQDSDSHRA